jgi:hypothetical protein
MLTIAAFIAASPLVLVICLKLPIWVGQPARGAKQCNKIGFDVPIDYASPSMGEGCGSAVLPSELGAVLTNGHLPAAADTVYRFVVCPALSHPELEPDRRYVPRHLGLLLPIFFPVPIAVDLMIPELEHLSSPDPYLEVADKAGPRIRNTSPYLAGLLDYIGMDDLGSRIDWLVREELFGQVLQDLVEGVLLVPGLSAEDLVAQFTSLALETIRVRLESRAELATMADSSICRPSKHSALEEVCRHPHTTLAAPFSLGVATKNYEKLQLLERHWSPVTGDNQVPQ